MCGVVGAVAQRNITTVLLEGLERLEYRGYDSVGVVVMGENQTLRRCRTIERVAQLKLQCVAHHLSGHCGMGHTRWATHGRPTEDNAHPHVSNDRIAVVHNGIIENYQPLRAQLEQQGYEFSSETDTEVLAHLIHAKRGQHPNLLATVQAILPLLEGAYAIGVLDQREPQHLVCARQGSPLLLGMGEKEYYFASDVAALLPVTQKVMYLEDGDVAQLSVQGVHIYHEGQAVERKIYISHLSSSLVELGPYRHFMQKEIHEQPRALADTLARIGYSIEPDVFGAEASSIFDQTQGLTLIACGTSFHAGLTAKYWIEDLAGLPVEVELASEYRYRAIIPRSEQLIVTISQSGETADTLFALKYAQSLGQEWSLSICNVPESSLVRASTLHFLTQAGPEIGVASTKAFTTQLVALYVLALSLAKRRGRLEAEAEQHALEQLRHVPHAVARMLALEPEMQVWADQLRHRHHALFLGRHTFYPIALEGSLKLKEISYIHAEAYAAGELKHGPLALVDEHMPVIVCAPNNRLADKIQSNIQEVVARKGQMLILSDIPSVLEQSALNGVAVPLSLGDLDVILYTIPLQLLAYHTALLKGTDVDKPRNLAKSVTVE
jgi:glucosamine--fructose-6-phosphate aminotransferase (isomerizing)